MSLIEKMKKAEIRELLIKNWMTHDAMWFRFCLDSIGIEKTNQINRAAIREMAKIEVERIKKILGINKIKSFDELKLFIENCLELLKGDFMNFSAEFNQNKIKCSAERCFAYEGIQRLGVIDDYECGIFERIHGWLDGLEIGYTYVPATSKCLMYENGYCKREYLVDI